jgi:hypothetical protein
VALWLNGHAECALSRTTRLRSVAGGGRGLGEHIEPREVVGGRADEMGML